MTSRGRGEKALPAGLSLPPSGKNSCARRWQPGRPSISRNRIRSFPLPWIRPQAFARMRTVRKKRTSSISPGPSRPGTAPAMAERLSIRRRHSCRRRIKTWSSLAVTLNPYPDRQNNRGNSVPLKAALDGESRLVVEHLVVKLLQPEGELPGEHGRAGVFLGNFLAKLLGALHHIGRHGHPVVGGKAEPACQA